MDNPSSHTIHHEQSSFLENYWDIIGGILFSILTYILHLNGIGALAALFAAISIIFISITISEIADILAERLDEPYGSFV